MSRILILGVTASGKSRLSQALARYFGSEIISIDSMKVYRRMDIGTAKASIRVRQELKYHLVDVVEPSESFSVDKFLSLAAASIERLTVAGKIPIASGGTAMYIKALLYGLFDGPGTDERIRQTLREQIASDGLFELYKRLCSVDPVASERIHPNDAKRIIRALEVFELTGRGISSFQNQFSPGKPVPEDWTIIGLRHDKAYQSQLINSRVKHMLDIGFVDEVRSLLDEPKPLSPQARCAIGYAEIMDYLRGTCDLSSAVERIKINTRRMAKSQRTWFKTFVGVHWLDVVPGESFDDLFKRAVVLLD